MAPLEVKGEKLMKILTSNELLPRLPILLAQVIAANNSFKLRDETKEILYILYQHNAIPKKL